MAESIGTVEGFDLGTFAPHLHAVRYLSPEDPALILRSASASLFAFHFATGDLASSGIASVALSSTGGRVSGAAQWLRLTFADDIIYENRPGSAADLHWVINLAPCEAHDTAPGAPFRAGAAYAADTLALWCAPDESGIA